MYYKHAYTRFLTDDLSECVSPIFPRVRMVKGKLR